jgi:signal transduction histidine kinase
MLPVNLGLFFVLDMPRLALQINLSTVLITPFVALLMAVLARGWETKDPRQQPALPRPVVIGFYSLLLILLAAASLPGLGLTKGAEIAIYLVQAHGLASGFLVLLMLQYRARFIQKQQQQAQQQLDRLQLQAEQDRHARHEQEQLLTMLTHELKTPLATMHMRLDAHTKGAPEIKRAIRDMNAIIERCLQSARLGDQGLQIHPSDFDVSALLHDAVSSCPAPERIQLIRSTPLLLKSDQQLLFIVISNLLENACKYSAPETPIRVEALPATPTTPQLQLVISNTVGRAGWPDKDKLFSKYYRTPGAQRQAGTGLGLFLVRNLLHKLGGQVYFAPQGEEVRFVVLLPSVDAS